MAYRSNALRTAMTFIKAVLERPFGGCSGSSDE